jgi:autotransporter-associated beta strand protein
VVFNSTSPQTAATNAPITLGILDLIGTASTTITGGYPNGTLTMQTSGGTGTAQINVSGGTTQDINLPLTFNSPTAISVATGSTLLISNPITMTGQTVTLTGGGTLALEVNFQVSGGTLQANAGVLQVGAQAIVSPSVLDVSGSAQLAGDGRIQGAVLYNSSAVSTFAGSIVGADSSLVLNASGSLTLSGDNTYGGDTVVNTGTLIVRNSNALPNGSSLTVRAGGTFIFDPSTAGSPAMASTIAAVPEPGTLVLLIVGVCGAAVYRRAWSRRKLR